MKPRGSVFEQCAVAVLAAALATAIAYKAIGFSQGLAVPRSRTGDAAWMTAIAKGFLEQGGIYRNPWLGAPGTQELFDFPSSDLLNWMVLRGLVLLVGAPVTATHLFLLGSFAVAAATAALIALRLRVLPPAALFVGVCFSLLPYHFYRGVGHLFLANYFMVPVAILMAVRLMGPLPVRPGSSDSMPYAMRSVLPSALACVVIGMTGIYYAVFSCMLWGIAGAYGWRRHGFQTLRAMLALVMVTGLVVVAQGLPNALYATREGRNPYAVERSRGGAELYGFRLGQLALPTSHHRAPLLRGIGRAYEAGLQVLGFPPTEAHDTAALGFLGGLGFLALLPLLVLTRDTDDAGSEVGENYFHRLSVLGVAVFLLGVSGGIGSLMGLVFPLIRAYNRISVFAGFLGLLTVAAAVTALSKAASPARSTLMGGLFCAVLLPLGVLDEVPVGVYDLRSASDDWKVLGGFVGEVEQKLPSGAMIFQLPYVPFPENPPVHRMHDYDHLKPYLHSRGIRWSYGTIKGRKVADWQRRVASLPPQEMVAELRGADFRGIWVDRFGYEDSGMALEKSLADALGGPLAIVSADGRYTFFSLD